MYHDKITYDLCIYMDRCLYMMLPTCYLQLHTEFGKAGLILEAGSLSSNWWVWVALIYLIVRGCYMYCYTTGVSECNEIFIISLFESGNVAGIGHPLIWSPRGFDQLGIIMWFVTLPLIIDEGSVKFCWTLAPSYYPYLVSFADKIIVLFFPDSAWVRPLCYSCFWNLTEIVQPVIYLKIMNNNYKAI